MAARFWVGGAGTWDTTNTTNWSATTGGAGGASVPGTADTVTFDALSGTGVVTTAAGISTVISITYNSTTLTSLTLGANVTASGTITLTAGTINLGTSTLSCNSWSSTGSTARSIAFGTGNLTVTGISFNMAIATSFTYTGTPTVNISNASATATTFWFGSSGGGSEANALDINFTTGTYTLTLTSGSVIRNLNFTGFAGTWSPGTGTYTVYRNLTFASGMTFTAGTGVTTLAGTSVTQLVTSAGKTLGPLTQSGVGSTVQFATNTTLSATSTYTFTNGTLDLATGNIVLSVGLFQSLTTSTRVINFGTGNITSTGSGSAFSTTGTGLTYTGTPTVNITYAGATAVNLFPHTSGGTESNVFDFNISGAGTYTLLLGSGAAVRNINFTGFTGTWNQGSNTSTYYGNITLVNGMTFTTPLGTFTFAKTSGTQTIFPANKTNFGPIVMNGVGGTFQPQAGTLTLTSASTFTLTNGTLDLATNSAILSCGIFSSSNSNIRVIAFGTSQITLTGNNTTVLITGTITNFSTTGTVKIVSTPSVYTGTRIFNVGPAWTVGAASTNQVSFGTTGGDAVAFATGTGMTNLDFTGYLGTWSNGINQFGMSGNLTIDPGMTVIPSTAGSGAVILNATSGTQIISSAGKTLGSIIQSVSAGVTVRLASALTIQAAASQQYSYNSGILDLNNFTLSAGSFSTSVTVSRTILFGTGNITVTGPGANFSAIGTNLTYTGTPSIYISYSGATASSISLSASTFTVANILDFYITTGTYTFTMNASATFRNIDFTGFSGIFSRAVSGISSYGNVILSSTMTTSSTQAWSLIGTTTQNITCNGSNIGILTMNSSTGTFKALDAFYGGSVTLTAGTFDANGFNVTLTSNWNSNNSNVRTILMGGGTWTIQSSATTAWDTTGVTNLTFNKSTSNIVLDVLNNYSTQNFNTGGLTFNNLTVTSTTVPVTIVLAGSGIFNTVTISRTGLTTLILPSGSTTNMSTLVFDGSSGNLATLRSTLNPNARPSLNVVNPVTLNYSLVMDVSLNSVNGTVVNGYIAPTTSGFTLGSGTNYFQVLGGFNDTQWVVPTTWDSANNVIHLIGAGGGSSGTTVGTVTNNRTGGSGGGGGAYAKAINQTYASGSTIYYNLGLAGTGASGSSTGGVSLARAGAPTYWGGTSLTSPTFISSTLSQQTVASTTITVTIPGTVTNGNLMLMILNSSTTTSIWEVPAGWNFGNTVGNGMSVFWRVVNAEPANYVVTQSASGTSNAYIIEYANAELGRINTATGGASTPTISPTFVQPQFKDTPGCTIVYVAASNGASTSFSTPTGYTVLGTDTDANAPSMSVFALNNVTTSLSYTPPSTTVTGTAGWGYLIVLNPVGNWSLTAGGGGGGYSSGGTVSTGGAGGIASGTALNLGYTGGVGGSGGITTTGGNAGGGGGAGAAGPGGVGGNGGSGISGATSATTSGGGGGGNGGGSAGGNASATFSGAGGNNALGYGGGVALSTSVGASGNTGWAGGGASGAAGAISSAVANGGIGFDIVGMFGGSGGSGGSVGADGSPVAYSTAFGGGSGGAGSNSTSIRNGANGGAGVIIILWNASGVIPITVSITETSSISTILDILATLNVPQIENFNANDSNTTQTNYNQSINENSIIDDTNSIQSNYNQSVTEDTIIDDTNSVQATYNPTISENIDLASVEEAVVQFILDVSEAITVDDLIAVGATFIRSISEDMTLGDANDVFQFLAENINLSDSADVKVTYILSILENVGLLDTAITSGWIKINDDQSVTWNNVNNASSATWTTINNENTQSWTNVNNSSATSWNSVNNDNLNTWDEINNSQ